MVITLRIYSGGNGFGGGFGKYLEVSLHHRRAWRRGICHCLSRVRVAHWHPHYDCRNHAGRRSQRNPVETMELLTEEAGADSNWHYLGWMGVIAGVLILSYYSVIAGWASAYMVKAFAGSFFDADGAAIKGIFTDFVASPSGEQGRYRSKELGDRQPARFGRLWCVSWVGRMRTRRNGRSRTTGDRCVPIVPESYSRQPAKQNGFAGERFSSAIAGTSSSNGRLNSLRPSICGIQP